MAKLKENPYIPEDYKKRIEKEAKEKAENPEKWIKDRYYSEIPKNETVINKG